MPLLLHMHYPVVPLPGRIFYYMFLSVLTIPQMKLMAFSELLSPTTVQLDVGPLCPQKDLPGPLG